MGLKNGLVKAFLNTNRKRIDNYRSNPVATQKKVFETLLKKAVGTEWGKQYNYSTIRSREEFAKKVPIQDYESFWPWIDRLRHNEQNIIWPSTIKWFSKSSGTTSSKSKYIPVSKENLKGCHLMGGRDIMTEYIRRYPDTKAFEGRNLIMGGSTEINKDSAGSFSGDVSAVMLSNTPWIVNMLRAPSKEVALMANWDEKIDKMADECLNQNITGLAGVPTWTIVLIRYLFEMTGKDDLRDIWPGLEYYVHGGVSFTPYRDQFKTLIPHDDMRYIESYNASEGFFAYQDEPDADGMLLMTDHGVYYEFIPMDAWGDEFPTSVPLEEVETGVNYALIISTNAGLWRYAVGDTIQFTETNPYRLIVSGRTKHFINAFGEEVMVDNTDKALAEACRKHDAMVSDYTAAPVYLQGDSKGGHEWLIEFERSPSNLDGFTKDLDGELQRINSDYEAKRFKDMALTLPRVHAVEKGTFHEWLRSKGKIGGQHKVPRLSNNRNYVDEILDFVNKTI